MRFVQPAILVLGSAIYFALIVFLAQYENSFFDSWLSDPTTFFVTVVVWNLLIFAATIIAIVDGVRRIRAKKTKQLATDAMVGKLISVPFFLLNFAALVFLFQIGAITAWMGIGIVIWIAVGVAAALTYLTMLSTSVPVWMAIVQLRRERIIGTGLTVLYILLSLLFITDIAAGVLLFGHSRRRPRLTTMWLFLATGIALIGLGALDYAYHFLEQIFIILTILTEHSSMQWLAWGIPAGLGLVIILPTLAISIVRRKDLRLEAQRAATARTPVPVPPADVSDGELAV